MGRFRDFIQGTMAEATGNGRRHPCVHCCERSSIENEAAKQIIAKSSKVGTDLLWGAPTNRCNAPALRRRSRMSAPTHTLSRVGLAASSGIYSVCFLDHQP